MFIELRFRRMYGTNGIYKVGDMRRMMRSRTMNMSEGRPLRLLAMFALPLFIGSLFQQA